MDIQRILIVLLAFVAFIIALKPYHITPHQHCTIWTRFGKVMKGQITTPGLHFRNPLTTIPYDLFIEEQIDSVENVECGTSDGITLVFDRIDVSNRCPSDNVEKIFNRYGYTYDQIPIYKNVAYFMGQMCSKMTAEEVYVTKFDTLDEVLMNMLKEAQLPQYDDEGKCTAQGTGLEILKVKMYKPLAKNSNIIDNFKKRAEAAASQKALKADEERIRQESVNELSKQQGVLERENAKNKAALQRKQDDMEADLKRQEVNNMLDIAAAQKDANVTLTRARASSKAKELEAEANAKLYTEAYLRHEAIRSYYNNAKFVVGDSIPKSWMGPHSFVGKEWKEGEF